MRLLADATSEDYRYPPIGFIRGCFTEKFGVPRQSMMVAEARAVLKLNQDPDFRVALNHLSTFSHLWIVFAFHRDGREARAAEDQWRPTIRPPRVDGPRRVGVFASRSPHRPNPIGISAVKLEKIDLDAPEGIEIHLAGVDLLDGTPVLDIKPYLPYADSIPEASSGWAEGTIPRYAVEYTAVAERALELASERHPRLHQLITQMLEWDPRPTSQRRAMPIEDPQHEGLAFGFRVLEFDVKWRIHQKRIEVTDLIVVQG